MRPVNLVNMGFISNGNIPPLALGYIASCLKRHEISDVQVFELVKCPIAGLSFRIYERATTAICSQVTEWESFPVVCALINDFNHDPRSHRLGESLTRSSMIRNYLYDIGLNAYRIADDTRKCREWFLSRSFEQGIYALSINQANIFGCALVSLLLRDFAPRSVIIWGGPQITQSPLTRELALRGSLCDYAYVGEAEVAFHALIQSIQDPSSERQISNVAYLDGSEVVTTEVRFVSDLNELPFPDFDWVDFSNYKSIYPTLTIDASRGCIFRCRFCAEHSLFSNRFRHKSPDRVSNELHYLSDRHTVNHFSFMDSLLDFSDEWLDELCDLLISHRRPYSFWAYLTARSKKPHLYKKLFQAGCRRCTIGVESFSSCVTGNMKKGGRNHDACDVEEHLGSLIRSGIRVEVNQLVGYPGEDDVTFFENLDHIIRIRDAFRGFEKSIEFHSQSCQLRPGSIDYERSLKHYHEERMTNSSRSSSRKGDFSLQTLDDVFPAIHHQLPSIPLSFFEVARYLPFRFSGPLSDSLSHHRLSIHKQLVNTSENKVSDIHKLLEEMRCWINDQWDFLEGRYVVIDISGIQLHRPREKDQKDRIRVSFGNVVQTNNPQIGGALSFEQYFQLVELFDGSHTCKMLVEKMGSKDKFLNFVVPYMIVELVRFF